MMEETTDRLTGTSNICKPTKTTASRHQRQGSFTKSASHLIVHTILVFIVHLLAISCTSQAYVITLDAGIENECFHERVPIGTKLGFSFEVIEGGFYDVDVDIKDANNVILHQDERASNGKYTIEATMEGPYMFCFNNNRSSFAPKVIIFDIDKSDASPKSNSDRSANPNAGKEDGEIGKLMTMVDQLMFASISTRHDVKYLAARDRIHRKVNEKTNKTIIWWSGIEFLLLLAVTIGQVFYLKRFFEIRRKA